MKFLIKMRILFHNILTMLFFFIYLLPIISRLVASITKHRSKIL